MQNNAVVKHHNPGDAGCATLIRQTKHSSAKRGHDYSLSNAGVRELSALPCYLCGQLPSMVIRVKGNSTQARKQFGTYMYNGLDRIDNTRGYIPGNVAPCCDYCNTAKNDQSYAEFIARVHRISARHTERAVS